MKHTEWAEYQIDVLTRRTTRTRVDLEKMTDEEINNLYEDWAAGFHF